MGQWSKLDHFSTKEKLFTIISGLYYKPMVTVNDNSRIVNKLEASLTDDPRVVIYNHHMFIVQVTDYKIVRKLCNQDHFRTKK